MTKENIELFAKNVSDSVSGLILEIIIYSIEGEQSVKPKEPFFIETETDQQMIVDSIKRILIKNIQSIALHDIFAENE